MAVPSIKVRPGHQRRKAGTGTWLWRGTILLGPGGAAFLGFVLFVTGIVEGNPTTWLLPFASLGFPAGTTAILGMLGLASPATEIEVGSLGVMMYVIVMPIYLALNPTIPAADVMNIYPTATQVCIACLGILQAEHGVSGGMPWGAKLVPSVALGASFSYRYHTDPGTSGFMLTSALTICGFQFVVAFLQEYYIQLLAGARERLRREGKSRQRLLHAAFDATCWLQCTGVSGSKLEDLDPSNIVLEVTKCSDDFDALFGQPMRGENLDAQCIVHGLNQLQEVMVQALHASPNARDSTVSRAHFTGIDVNGAEFDCEVRAVPDDQRSGHTATVLCGVRVAGEKRQPFLEGHPKPTRDKRKPKPRKTASDDDDSSCISMQSGSRPHWLSSHVSRPKETLLNALSLLGLDTAAEPSRAPLEDEGSVPKGRAEVAWEAMRAIPGAACIACTTPALRIWDATPQALELLQTGDARGQVLPTYVANAQAAQTLRKAVALALKFASQKPWQNGYMSREFGTLGLKSQAGTSNIDMHVTLFFIAADTPSGSANVIIVFRGVTAGILHGKRRKPKGDGDAASESSKSTRSRVTFDEESIAASSNQGGGRLTGLRRRAGARGTQAVPSSSPAIAQCESPVAGGSRAVGAHAVTSMWQSAELQPLDEQEAALDSDNSLDCEDDEDHEASKMDDVVQAEEPPIYVSDD